TRQPGAPRGVSAGAVDERAAEADLLVEQPAAGAYLKRGGATGAEGVVGVRLRARDGVRGVLAALVVADEVGDPVLAGALAREGRHAVGAAGYDAAGREQRLALSAENPVAESPRQIEVAAGVLDERAVAGPGT